MRRMPCWTKKCPGGGWATLPNGAPYLMGRAPTKFPFRVPCSSCQRPTFLTAADFHAQPLLSMAELHNLGQLDPLLKDLRGAGFGDLEVKDKRTGQIRRVKPAEDLWGMGFRSPVDFDLIMLDRENETERQFREAISAGLDTDFAAKS